MAATIENAQTNEMIKLVPIRPSTATYLMWKHHFLPMATIFGMLGMVNETETALPPFVTATDGTISPNLDYTKWCLKDHMLLCVLFATLLEKAMVEVLDCNTVRATWLALEATYTHASTSRANQLREALLSLWRNMFSVAEYGKIFKAIHVQLSAID